MRLAKQRIIKLIAVAALAVLFNAGGLAAQTSDSGKALQVKAISMGSFTRIKFDSEEKIRIESFSQKNSVVVNFSPAVALDVPSLLNSLRGIATDVEQQAAGKQLIITLKKPHRIRNFVSSKSFGFDLIPVPAEEVAATEQEEKLRKIDEVQKKEEAKQQVELQISGSLNSGIIFGASDRLKYKTYTNKQGEVFIEFEKDVKLISNKSENVRAINSKTYAIGGVDNSYTFSHKRKQNQVVITFKKQEPKAAEPDKKQDIAVKTTAEPEKKVASSEKVVEPQAQTQPQAQAQPETPSVPENTIGVKTSVAEVNFPFKRMVPMVVIDRSSYNKTVSAFFETSEVFPVIPIKSFDFISQIVTENLGSVQRYDIGVTDSAGYPTTKIQDGITISVDSEQRKPMSQYKINIEQLNSNAPNSKPETVITITKSSGKIAKPIEVEDSATGARLLLIPDMEINSGNPEDREFVEMLFPKTTTGAAVYIYSDSVSWQQEDSRIILRSSEGLALSSSIPEPPPAITQIRELQSTAANDNQQAEPIIVYSNSDSVFVPYEEWNLPKVKGSGSEQDDEYENINSYRARVIQNILKSPDDAANAWRARLAGAYLARGMIQEGLIALQNLERMKPEFYNSTNLVGAEAAALFMRSDYDAAKAKLETYKNKASEELKMWEQLVKMAKGESVPDFSYQNSNVRFISKYPPAFRRKIAFMVLDKQIKDGNFIEAEKTLKSVKSQNDIGIDILGQQKLKLYEALIANGKGERDKSSALFDELSRLVNNPEVRAKSSFESLRRDLLSNSMSISDGIKQLESLRNTWREPDFELPLLSFLGDLYWEQKNYKEALDTWRYLASNFPNTSFSADAAKKMSEGFIQLFNRGLADAMTPIEALTLYYEFRELTPTGSEGDLMIQNLADRLVGVELLDRASALLTHQVRFRLKDQDKARIGARLALIHLMNNQPKLAVEVIDYTDFAGVNSELALVRSHLKAQALYQSGKPEEAVQVLEGDESQEGLSLKAEILWSLKDWKRVSSFIQSWMDKLKEDEILNYTENIAIIRLAMAYLFEGNAEALSVLRTDFLDKMYNDFFYEQFDFITRDDAGINHKEMERVSKTISGFKSFMENFAEKVKEGGLSSAVEGGGS